MSPTADHAAKAIAETRPQCDDAPCVRSPANQLLCSHCGNPCIAGVHGKESDWRSTVEWRINGDRVCPRCFFAKKTHQC